MTVKTHNLTITSVILETQITSYLIKKQIIFKKTLTYFSLNSFLYVLLLMQTTYNCVDNIKFWHLTFKNKHNFLHFFLNRATGGFILIFLISIFLKICSESNLTLSFEKKNAVSSYFGGERGAYLLSYFEKLAS